jgi:hypothetical protein
MDSRWRFLHRWMMRLTHTRCRGGREATRRGSFKLVGRHSNPVLMIEKRVRASMATCLQVPGTCAAEKGLCVEYPNARTGHRHRWIG